MRAFFFLFVTIPLLAQFSGLATTDNGSQLYFSSQLQLAGSTDENSYAKIFRYDASGIHLVAQVAKIATAGGIQLANTNPYNLTSAYVSGDGTTFGYVGIADCTGSCYYTGLEQTTLQYPSSFTPYTLPYGCAISKNARYASCITSGRGVFPNFGVFDLFGYPTPIYSPACNLYTGIAQITSSGAAFCGNTLYSASGMMTLSLPPYGTYRQIISDDASTVITNATDSSLTAFNLSSSAQSTFYVDTQARDVDPLSLSNSGKSILFEVKTGVAPNAVILQAAIVHSDGTGFLQLTNEPGGIAGGVLSGDGSTAYVVTNGGKLLKINTATGISTLIASAAQIVGVTGATVPGSLLSIQGFGLADIPASASTLPLPTSLGGTQVTVNGTPVPILSVSPTSISFQMPWETPLGTAIIAVARPASQFTALPAQLTIAAVQPFAILNQAINQNFQLNDSNHPANPGDIISFYVTGLGAVTPSVADGVASPSDPLALVAAPVTVLYGAAPLQVLYAGLAPGTVGVYQLTVKSPPLIPHRPFVPPGGENNVGFTLNSYGLPAVWFNTNQ